MPITPKHIAHELHTTLCKCCKTCDVLQTACNSSCLQTRRRKNDNFGNYWFGGGAGGGGVYKSEAQMANDLIADRAAVGTDSYKGIALFWDTDSEVKNYMRTATATVRKKVHKAFLKNHIPIVDEENNHKFFVSTDKAKEIVYSILKRGGVAPVTVFDRRKLRERA